MSNQAKKQHHNILYAIIGFAAVVIIVALIGFFALGRDPEIIQGQVEVSEYRVSSKVPGRILEIRVKEGDYVHAGDTLAILDAPEVRAKMQQAQGAEDGAAALEMMAKNGARKEQVQGAYQVYQQATAALEIAEKSYNRVQRLFDEGVVSAQKRDEALAMYKASEAQMKAAKSQYDMAVNGARQEEKLAAQAQLNRAKGAVQEVNAYIGETVQIAQMDGEVSSIYPEGGRARRYGQSYHDHLNDERYVGHIQRARGPVERHAGRHGVHRFRTRIQQGNQVEGVSHEGPGLVCCMEGYEGQRTV